MLRLAALVTLTLLCSCAYMQTHKNVGELGAHYNGHVLNCNDLKVYHDAIGQRWYVGAHEARFKLEYPIIYDSVFRRQGNNPTFRPAEINPGLVYHPIDESTARVLISKDGFIQLHVLAEQINRPDSGSWTSSPRITESYRVAATIDGETTYQMPSRRIPTRNSLATKILKNIDLIVIDVPGTLVYNVAIPFAAPFVFFYEFYHDKP